MGYIGYGSIISKLFKKRRGREDGSRA